MITFLFLLIILGGGLWILEHSVQMAPVFVYAIRLVVVLILLWFALALLGFAPSLPRGALALT